MRDKSTKTMQRLRQISDMLILNGTLTECPGLVHGKMGISIFFFHYARLTSNELFEEYAMDLIKEIQLQIHNNSAADFERGIAGIGIGMDYLIKNRFLEADTDVFDDFDKRMYRAVMYDPFQDCSLYDGLTGYGYYWLMRFMSSKNAVECLLHIINYYKEQLPFVSENELCDIYCLLHELCSVLNYDICHELLDKYRKKIVGINLFFPYLGKSSVGNFVRMNKINYYLKDIISDKKNKKFKYSAEINMKNTSANMGLLTGYAGEGLLYLTFFHNHNVSWIKLL